MTRPDLVFAYSELNKYVQRPGKAHMRVELPSGSSTRSDEDTVTETKRPTGLARHY
jgi:hypothetical protein